MTSKSGYRELPLVYACSGCSSAAQLANTLAVKLDRNAQAEMSCVAGVGGDVDALVKTAKSGRKKIVLDGCPLHCAINCLRRQGLNPKYTSTFPRRGSEKMHADPCEEEIERIWNSVVIPQLSMMTEP
ncbi:putative zinc-binding protein [Microbulbifer sp. VAAF005]|uniref:putative zinc-binding protein n=1 Tax=Microbulbifer sp. VAAF005 TaxID=3034230 RepID=UPI0024AC996C|nr:putative zinc-binding protein [Microbulbifer sp. VAAF005]WHI47021.1 putative zinc-binding protein [Microbulbifer sp. VAAF005]